jgi:hypothetical protein
MYAKSRCTVSSVSDTQIICTLDNEPTCGDNVPYVTGINGLVNNSQSITPVTTTCTVSSVYPTHLLNLLGRDNLTISGTYFPSTLNTSTVDVTFNDANATKCVPQWSTNNNLVCLTSEFNMVSAGQTIGMVITING